MDKKNNNKDYLIENSYLQKVLKCLNEEINNYISRRKEITEVIVDYRKKFIEEYRDDDDRVINYFDHENHKNEHVFNTIEKRIKELLYLKKSPYFGKIKIKEGIEEEENFYIGFYGLDVGEEVPLIIDWRAPIASLFYQGKLGEVSYTIPSKEVITVDLLERTQFLIKNGEIISMFNSEIDIKDEFLKKMLNVKSLNKLKNIVQTIQANQDKIIRANRNENIVINGVAGSGKTSIALHRVAYLLYNHRDYFQDKVLILGPNKIFMEYISYVLPSLGEDGVCSFTGEDFIFMNMDENLNLNFNSYDNHMEKILNDSEYLKEFRFKGSLEAKENIDEFLKYVSSNINFERDIYFRDEVVITKDEISKLFNDVFKSRVIEVRINLIRRKIVDKINKIRNKYVREISTKYDSMHVEEDMLNYYDMLKRNEIYEVISESLEIKSSLHFLKLESPYELYREFYEEYFAKDLRNLDFADLILIQYIYLKLYDVKRKREYKLVVIDEAQDFSYMFYEVIKTYTKAVSYVIVGDLHQSITNLDENYITSTEMFPNRVLINIRDSYRSTSNIIDYAVKYLHSKDKFNAVRDGEDVEEITCEYSNLKNIIRNKVESLKSKGNNNIGILVKDKNSLYKVKELISGDYYIKILDNEDQVYSENGVFLTTVYFSKGLEFDSVIVLDDSLEDNILYIMITRAMHSAVHIRLKG